MLVPTQDWIRNSTVRLYQHSSSRRTFAAFDVDGLVVDRQVWIFIDLKTFLKMKERSDGFSPPPPPDFLINQQINQPVWSGHAAGACTCVYMSVHVPF